MFGEIRKKNDMHPPTILPMTPIIENSRLSGYIGTLGSPPGSQFRRIASFVSEMLGEKGHIASFVSEMLGEKDNIFIKFSLKK